ncbi:MAG: 50S ribosomal protein L9 [Candidatus Nealsonbacteria bacterium]|nr:50S ribosomal protein L9 [Candidatus Nealsonbacteria bacterium]
MKVILIKNVEKIGKKYDVKEVKDGYAMNYLIPNNLARPATREALQWLDIQLETDQKKQEDSLKKVQALVSKIDGLEVSFDVKIGEKDQLFESITAVKIKEKLKGMGFEVDKNQIELKEPIKKLGEFNVKLSFEHNLEVSIKVLINEEK